jgi:hypothetical protein
MSSKIPGIEDLDLNIDNYELMDIFRLFNIDKYNFDVNDMKSSKKIVLMTHPDKSKLDKKYFLFFAKAYKILESLYKFRNKEENKNTSYDQILSTDKEIKERNDLYKLIKDKKNDENFSKWFNDMFEKTNIKDSKIENGYGKWLSSDEDIDDRTTTQSNMNETFERKKKELKSIIVYNDYSTITYNEQSTYRLDEDIDAPSTYSSDLFSKLKFDDLKRAHTETVVPVTIDDYNNKKKYSNIQELKNDRHINLSELPSMSQSNTYLNNIKELELKTDTERAFKLAKQDEHFKKVNNLWWSNFKQLSN